MFVPKCNLEFAWGKNIVVAVTPFHFFTRILKISIKNFMEFRNVRKSIETSDDILVATLTHHILRGSEVLNPVEWTQDHSAKDVGFLILEDCDGSK